MSCVLRTTRDHLVPERYYFAVVKVRSAEAGGSVEDTSVELVDVGHRTFVVQQAIHQWSVRRAKPVAALEHDASVDGGAKEICPVLDLDGQGIFSCAGSDGEAGRLNRSVCKESEGSGHVKLK